MGAAVVVVVLAGAWWTARSGGEPGLSPGQVVTAFFQAQRDGDCERVVDLVSEASWSDGGERSRGEFLEQCEGALDGYRPAVNGLEISGVAENGDRVTVANPHGHVRVVFQHDEELPRGRLVRGEGRWWVRLDDWVLHLGPGVDEVVRGYLDAYNQADCGRLAGFLSESLWPANVRSRAELVRRCEREVDDPGDIGRPYALEASQIEVSVAEHERAEVAVTMHLGGQALLGGPSAETVRLVREGLRWRLAGSEDLPDGWAGVPLRAVAYAELEARLVDEVVTATACSGYSDLTDVTAEPNARVAGAVSITRSFPQCDARVGVYRFSDDEAARDGARSMADAVIGDPFPGADLDATEAEVPRLPDALGVRAHCAGERCSSASAYVARGPMVVAVTMEGGDLEDAASILAAQLERL